MKTPIPEQHALIPELLLKLSLGGEVEAIQFLILRSPNLDLSSRRKTSIGEVVDGIGEFQHSCAESWHSIAASQFRFHSVVDYTDSNRNDQDRKS